MIDFTAKTYRNLLRTQLDRVPDSLDKREGSLIQTAVGAGAYALEEFYLELDQVQRGAYLQTAVGQDLDYLAVLANVQRYPASPAVRLGVFNVDVPRGARFSTIDGADSVNFAAGEQVGPGQFQMLCETPGAIGNRYTGPILPITHIQGLTSAEITDILVSGDNTESDDSLRQRAIDALNEQPFGGNVADYRRVVLAIDGVGGLQVYPVWSGGGTVKLSIQDSYYNMKERILPHMELIEVARAAMEEEGITPLIVPVRGGTDGARLSFKGLPCPNLCCGALNTHGPYEYCSIQDMQKIVAMLIRLVRKFGERQK